MYDNDNNNKKSHKTCLMIFVMLLSIQKFVNAEPNSLFASSFSNFAAFCSLQHQPATTLLAPFRSARLYGLEAKVYSNPQKIICDTGAPEKLKAASHNVAGS
jgi:hypothetical protein